jgi:hypothetical protein
MKYNLRHRTQCAMLVAAWLSIPSAAFRSTNVDQAKDGHARPRSYRRGLPLLVVVFALANLALVAQLKAINFSDTFYGSGADGSISTGTNDSAFGTDAMNLTTSGSDNTAIGAFALDVNNTGSDNTAVGSDALENNTSSNNTAVGSFALISNTSGSNNTATGFDALLANTSGSNNTAYGANALISNTSASNNTATGAGTLYHNSTGTQNTANGVTALLSNTTGNFNTANGVNALHSNTTGSFNTADGLDALYANTSGFSNVGIGANAGRSLTGSGNVCIGVNVYGVAGESNTTRIKNVYSSIASGRAVYVNSDNKIGTLSSSRRFKEEIKPMEQVSEALFALKPVTFRYKKEIDPNGTKQFGLVAEEVARVDPVLVTRDGEGKPETVRYEAVNAMLLNEFLKEHQKVEEQGRELQGQKAINAELRSTIAQQQKDIKALVTRQNEQDAKIERVNAKVELAKPQPEVVENR